MLTERTIRSASPSDKDVFIADRGGLYLRVAKSGAKTFLHKDQRGGKTKWSTIGRYPEMSLAEARAALARVRATKAVMTVSEAFDAYYAHISSRFVAPQQVHRMFHKDVIPKLGAQTLPTVTRADTSSILRAITERGSPAMANRLLSQMKRFLTYCVDQGWVDTNVLAGVQRKNVGGKEKSRERTLSLDELESLLRNLMSTKSRMSPGTRWGLYGCILTGQRVTEVLTMAPDGSTFTKMQRHHRVPLTPHVRAWLKVRPAHVPSDHRVLAQMVRVMHMGFTPHDLRRTFASQLAGLGVATHVIEKLLDHRMVGVMAIYNRAEYWPERVAAQRLWGKIVRDLRKKAGTSPAEVPS